jgi:ATP-dependent Clp protease ATP-binding subunit ClpE
MGARPLRRVIQEQIEDRVADFYLDHPNNSKLEARISDGNIVITGADAPESAPKDKAK